jgi:hypothetical protein
MYNISWELKRYKVDWGKAYVIERGKNKKF